MVQVAAASEALVIHYLFIMAFLTALRRQVNMLIILEEIKDELVPIGDVVLNLDQRPLLIPILEVTLKSCVHSAALLFQSLAPLLLYFCVI